MPIDIVMLCLTLTSNSCRPVHKWRSSKSSPIDDRTKASDETREKLAVRIVRLCGSAQFASAGSPTASLGPSKTTGCVVGDQQQRSLFGSVMEKVMVKNKGATGEGLEKDIYNGDV